MFACLEECSQVSLPCVPRPPCGKETTLPLWWKVCDADADSNSRQVDEPVGSMAAKG